MREYSLYWIHREGIDTDPYTEGYIGVTNNLRERHGYHVAAVLKGTKHPLYASVRQHLDYIMIVLHKGKTLEQVNALELKYRPEPSIGKNIRQGGGSHGRHSDATRAIISEKHKGKKLSPEHARKLRESRLGRKASAETCRKISAAKMGKPRGPHTLATRRKISESAKGHIVTEETRRKISKAQKGIPTPWQTHNRGRKYYTCQHCGEATALLPEEKKCKSCNKVISRQQHLQFKKQYRCPACKRRGTMAPHKRHCNNPKCRKKLR